MQTLLCRGAASAVHQTWIRSSRRTCLADLRFLSSASLSSATPLSHKRVFGVAAHIDAGKTTACEAILHSAGALTRSRMGRVDAGDTLLDYLPAERARGITISAASAAFAWGPQQVFLVDSPGHLDFTFEVERALAVMDAVVVLVCAVAGVQPQTETVWRQADGAALPRLLVVNKCDREGARGEEVVGEVRGRFGVRAPVMQMAIGGEGGFRGVVDLVEMRVRDGEDVGGEVGAAEMERAGVLRQELVECVADVDDGVMELWMDERPVPADVLRAAVRAACARREIVPVFYAAALKDVGVREVMDAAVEYLPSPAERPAIKAVDEKGGTLQIAPVADGAFLAQAFKVTHDRHRGRLVHFRAFAGGMTDRKLPLWNCNKEVKERPSKWLRVLADEFQEVEHIECGDVFAMVGLRQTETGDTITSTAPGLPVSSVRLAGMEVPPAVCSIALETDSPSAQRTLDEFLARILAEDPSLRLTSDESTGETLLLGVGELHLEAVTDRIASELPDIEVRSSRPRVAYRESVSGDASHVEHYDARIGSAHLVASLRVSVSPATDAGVTVSGDNWSREQAMAIEEGVSAALGRGVLCGLQTRGVAAVVEAAPGAEDAGAGLVALRACASAATQKAMQAAGPVVLEPLMRVEVVVPDANAGDITAALSHPSRCRGVVDDVAPVRGGGRVRIQATAPLAGMMGWATQMRSVCKGRGDVSMVFDGYAPVPAGVADRLREGM